MGFQYRLSSEQKPRRSASAGFFSVYGKTPINRYLLYLSSFGGFFILKKYLIKIYQMIYFIECDKEHSWGCGRAIVFFLLKGKVPM
jgi:hypothetical protein